MPGAWTFDGAVTPPSGTADGSLGGPVTLVHGSTFCISGRLGDFSAEGAFGLFHRDTRIVSGWRLLVDSVSAEPLTVIPGEPYHATFLSRARPHGGLADSRLLVQRDRYVGAGMREDVVLRNLGDEPAGVALTLSVDADFADIFAVKEGHPQPLGEQARTAGVGDLRVDAVDGATSRGVHVTAQPDADAVATEDGLAFRVVVPAHGQWRVTLRALPVVDGVEAEPSYPMAGPLTRTGPVRQLAEWRRETPVVHTPHEPLRTALATTEVDLGALRIFDPDQPGTVIVAAGAPWFMTLFGRDSLLTSMMALIADPELAAGTLDTLAGLQGADIDPLTEEQPGRIPHEVRGGVDATRALGGRNVYYGTADATPLFVMALGELHRWGVDPTRVKALLPHADRALAWVEDYGDADGDGFVEYQRATDKGLRNQGWKDSFDGVNFADGLLAEPPIALAEVQGYVYAAYRARAHLARHFGDADTEAGCDAKADALKAAFNDRFWLPERGWYAVGLDRDKAPIDALASNMAHCLWTGIVDDARVRAVGDLLVTPEMFSGWGVRTLAAGMSRYNPMSYHNGSVWPHDNAIAVAGLARVGMGEAASRVALAVLDAGAAYGGRLPELLCGFGREEYARPVPYPAACSPQAWAAAAPLLMLRAMLGLEVCAPCGWISLRPSLPEAVLPLRLENVPLGDARLTITVDSGGARVDGLPAGVTLKTG